MLLDAWAEGRGEPLMLLRTALSAQHLVPLSREPTLAEQFRLLTYDRRGYGRSPAGEEPGTLRGEAEDAAAVLEHLGPGSAHVLGDSYSAAIAIELALAAPEKVRSLVLIEPPPVLAPGADRFLAANEQLMETCRSEGVEAALEAFLGRLAGPRWREEYDEVVPGMSERIQQDASAFFSRDVPALLGWSLDPARARLLDCPVLHVAGEENGPLFATVAAWLHGLLPRARTVTVPGAGHGVSFTHPAEVAAVVAEFLREQSGAGQDTPPGPSDGRGGSRSR